jgi:nitroreductase
MSSIQALKWRYATKQFDTDKTVDADSIQILKEAVNLAASSYGLQPFRVFLVTDKEVKVKLREAAYGQPQLTDASHIFVFAAKNDISDEYVDDYMQRIADTRRIDVANLKGFGDTIKGSIYTQSSDDVRAWNQRQAYIALGTLLQTAAELHVDACPMEGFVPDQVNEVLGLEEKGLSAVVIAPVGHRSSADKTAKAAKVRLKLDELFTEI